MAPFDNNGYTAVFGGQNRAPAQIDYVRYDYSTNLHLEWPFLAEDGAYVCPAKIDLNPSAAGLLVYLPDASIASVGQDVLIRNVGAYPAAVCDHDGGSVLYIDSGLQWLMWITDDQSVPGVWARVQFGAGVSNAVAGALAGYGLRANNVNKLDQDLYSVQLTGAYQLKFSDRAKVIENTGGTVTHTFDPVSPTDQSQLANGWFVYEKNAGTGTVTLQPSTGVTIDGAANKVLQPGESCIIFSDGTKLITIGYGRALSSSTSGVSMPLNTYTSPYSLTTSQVLAQVQNWTGALSSNMVLDFSGSVGYWMVWNNTTGPYTVTARVSSADTGAPPPASDPTGPVTPCVVPQGNYSILRSDGTNMHVAFTATQGTVTAIYTTPGETTGGPPPTGITSTGTIGLADTTVIPGTYGAPGAQGPPAVGSKVPVMQIDQKGRAVAGTTFYTLGTTANFNIGTVSGTIPLNTQSSVAQLLGYADDPAIPGVISPMSGGVPCGTMLNFGLVWAPPGWIFCVGSIGKTGSGASNRANQDCRDLFCGIYLSFADAQCPVSGGRTGNTSTTALADFNAGKVISLPDMRGRTMVGLDNLGSTLGIAAAGRVTNAQAAPNGNTMGAVGGLQQTTATIPQMAIGVNIEGGYTTGAQSVHVYGNTGNDNSTKFGGIVGSGDVLHGDHQHYFDGGFWTDGQNLSTHGAWTVYNNAGYATGTFCTMEPFLMTNVIIKL